MSGGGKQPHHRLFQPHNPEPSAPPPQQDYGAFPGVLGDTSPSPPAIGFSQPAPPPWAISPSSGPPYYAEGRQAVPDDDWLEDGSDSAELNRERKARENEFHSMGYRDGIIAGKEASAQEGFNAGFKKAVLGGYKWGFVRGVTSALAGLPDSPRGKLVESVEKKGALGKLCETVRSISTDDALRMFQDGMPLAGAAAAPRGQQGGPSSAGATANGEDGARQLGRYYGELRSLISELGDVELPVED